MNQMMEEDTSASLQTSVTRADTIYQLSDVKKEDVQKVPLVYSIWGAARKLKENTAQLSTQAVANVAAAAEKAAADVAALERAAAEQTGATVAVKQAVAIKTGAEAVTTGDNLHEELERMQLVLIAERAAAAAARDEATAAIYILEAENKRLLLLLAAANSPVPVPVAAANSPVPANANLNGPTTRTQPATLAMSNSLTYAQAVTSSVPDVRRLPRTNDLGGDRSANAASASATADPASAIMMSPTVLQHNLADHAKAAALQAAADAAAAAATDPKILRAVLLAAAATANALASTIPLDAVPTHRRGGRPPKTRRANARPRPRRTRRPTGMHTGAPAPTADSTSTARQPSQHSAFADSPPRAGQARPRPGARPPRFDSTRSTTLATRQILPKVEPTVMRLNGRD